MTSKCVLCQQLIIHEFRPWEIFIGKQIDQEYLCPRCFQEFQAINQPYCPTCGRLGSFQQCQDCQYWQAQGYRGFYHQALFTYNPAMHDYFKRYKRYGDYRLRLAFQPYLKQKLRKLEPPFIFVPSSQNHWQRRLFDPVMGLFEGIVPLTPALIKLATDRSQAQKNRQERLQTPQFFNFNPQFQTILQAPRITILDDIYTTGRTIFHAIDCLRQTGYRGQIQSFSLVR